MYMYVPYNRLPPIKMAIFGLTCKKKKVLFRLLITNCHFSAVSHEIVFLTVAGDDIDCGCAFDCIANISGGSVSSGCTNASISWGPNTNATDYSNYCVIVWREGKKVDCQSAEIGLEVNFPGLESGVEYRYQITANGGSNCSMEEAFVTKKCGFGT